VHHLASSLIVKIEFIEIGKKLSQKKCDSLSLSNFFVSHTTVEREIERDEMGEREI
jgi:hypothetical protein